MGKMVITCEVGQTTVSVDLVTTWKITQLWLVRNYSRQSCALAAHWPVSAREYQWMANQRWARTKTAQKCANFKSTQKFDSKHNWMTFVITNQLKTVGRSADYYCYSTMFRKTPNRNKRAMLASRKSVCVLGVGWWCKNDGGKIFRIVFEKKSNFLYWYEFVGSWYRRAVEVAVWTFSHGGCSRSTFHDGWSAHE